MPEKDYTISITKEQVQMLPVINFTGGITLVDTPESLAAAVAELERHPVIGFDTETRPSFQKGRLHKVALMQLSTPDHCWLIRLNKLGFPEPLKRLMENPDVVKVGLSVHDDFRVMQRSTPIDPAGFVDIQAMVGQWNIADISLQKVYAIVFGRKISKKQRLTNWEAPILTPEQQAYAALDAWACLKIYRALNSGQFIPEESPYKVYNDECADNTTDDNGKA